MVVREDIDSEPVVAVYRVTDLQKGKFLLEIAEPGTGDYEFFIEGKFENSNKINVTRAMDADGQTFALRRVKDLDKEIATMRKEQEKQQALEEKEQAAEEKERLKKEEEEKKKEKKLAEKKEEEKKQADEPESEIEGAPEEPSTEKEPESEQPAAKEEAESVPAGPAPSPYLREADALNERILAEYKQANPNAQDIEQGVYGQYYEEWDRLLNNIWAELKATMGSSQFEQLKQEQIQWVKQKEAGVKEYNEEVASERRAATDYETFETKDRVYYLIENYIQ